MANPTAIVVGAGHNGLVAAFYLARAGVSVLVLERRDIVGGACVTEELFPGFKISACSYVSHLLQEKVIRDMALEVHGLHIFPMDPFRFFPLLNGQYIQSWHDHHRTAEQIGRISPQDVAGYDAWNEFWERAGGILNRYFLSEPPSLSEVASTVRGTADELVFEQMLTGNMKDLVEQYFDHETIQTAFVHAHDAGDIRGPGSIMAVAYLSCYQFTPPQYVGIPQGGMGAITQAMARAAESLGVTIRTGVEIDRIEVRNGKVTGVALKNGEQIDADVVLSNADPKRTFLTLLDPDTLDSHFVRGVRQIKTEIACLKFHCVLRELPDFSSYLGANFDPTELAHVRICPSVPYFEQAWKDAREGRLPTCPLMSLQVPTVYDNTVAPSGQHIMSAWVLYAPVHLRDGSWDAMRQQVGEHLIQTISQYAPNVPDTIVDWALFTPADLERRIYLTDGNIRHGDVIVSQILARRPNRELSGYGTPIDGLYLCGAGTHPGGEVTGAPGHNAAAAVLRGGAVS